MFGVLRRTDRDFEVGHFDERLPVRFEQECMQQICLYSPDFGEYSPHFEQSLAVAELHTQCLVLVRLFPFWPGTSCPCPMIHGVLRVTQGVHKTEITNTYGKIPVFGENGDSQLA